MRLQNKWVIPIMQYLVAYRLIFTASYRISYKKSLKRMWLKLLTPTQLSQMSGCMFLYMLCLCVTNSTWQIKMLISITAVEKYFLRLMFFMKYRLNNRLLPLTNCFQVPIVHNIFSILSKKKLQLFGKIFSSFSAYNFHCGI